MTGLLIVLVGGIIGGVFAQVIIWITELQLDRKYGRWTR